MARSVPPLDPKRFRRVAGVLREWGDLHPVPDQPVLQLADGKELSPRDIARAMEEILHTEQIYAYPNARIIHMLFSVAVYRGEDTDFPGEPESLDDILKDFQRDITGWSEGRIR